MATTIAGTPFKLATVQASADVLKLKDELESVLRSTDAVILLEDEVVAVMAGSPKEVQAGAERVTYVLNSHHLGVDIRVEREPFRKRLQHTAERVIKGEVPVRRRARPSENLPQRELQRLYDEMRRQAWSAQQRVMNLETELRRIQMELEMQKISNEQLVRELATRRKRRLWKV